MIPAGKADRLPHPNQSEIGVEYGGCMAWDLSYSCDICGQKKGEANHWWMAVLEDQHCHEDGQPGKGFTLLPWNRDQCRSGRYYHLCGQNCAMQAMERFMNNGVILLEPSLSER
jgi:hypothetical protein